MTRPPVRSILSREEEKQVTAAVLQEKALDIGGSIYQCESPMGHGVEPDWDTADRLRKKAIILRLARRIILGDDPIDLSALDMELEDESRK